MQKLQKLVLPLLVVFMMLAGTVMAQRPSTSNVGQLLSGLVNVNVNVGDITVTDVINVTDVLNDNNVEILNNVLNRSQVLSDIANDLTIDLREANIITDNQVVVGLLSGGIIVVQ